MRLTWKQVCEARPVEIPGLLAFMERRRPGSTREVRAATPAQIAALVEPLDGGIDALPRVYLDFLETMGEHTGALEPRCIVSSVSALLMERSEPGRSRPDPNRYFKFSIGEDDYNGRQPDDFFDLSRMRPDRSDAAVVRILEGDLVRGRGSPDEPFASFSDQLRAVAASEFGLDTEAERSVAFGFGDDADAGAAARGYEFLVGLGFELTELGASPSRMVLEDPRRGAFALLNGPSPMNPGTLLRVHIPAGKNGLHFAEVLKDYRDRALGLA
ncbi:MAG: hypothetical protein H0T76_00730 [Nannocystis sp.]|nr:hypothetical protein [Nannocystis sp.]MBA3544985.1 hypothetical protein [Nannocystis sp.]